jgi:riboflavin synthase
MFTGIIEEVGQLEKIKVTNGGKELCIRTKKVTKDMNPGDSLAVNGICFTIVTVTEQFLTVFASTETLEKTTAAYWRKGEQLNLERPLRIDGRLDGHIVLGHIDFVGQVKDIKKLGQSIIIRIEYPSEKARSFVYKGSVAVDGISLTISSLDKNYFENAIIPFTWANTNLQSLTQGKKVNIETDIIGKYIERLLKNRRYSNKITEDYLKLQGF